MSAVAFFDLDLTLLGCNSATLWIKREVRLGHLTRADALRGAWWIGLYQLGLGSLEAAIGRAIATLEGTAEQEMRHRVRAFWEEEIHETIRPRARDVLARHRDQGDRVVLLTGSSPYMSELALEVFGLHDALCTRFEVQEGLFTGRAVGTLCYGAGKLVYAQSYAETSGVSLADCTFYTDSFSDVPVLEAVGVPVAVHPDPRLGRHARRRGWRVEDWG